MKTALFALVLASTLPAAPWSLVGHVGFANTWGGDLETRPAWSVHLQRRFDRMVSYGAGIGWVKLDGTDAAEASTRLQVRLPLGRQLLPYLEAEGGAGIRPVLADSRFLWRLGGGLDLKLGDRSSLLLSGGSMAFHSAYLRLGLLLEP